jgi:hypothetical protein
MGEERWERRLVGSRRLPVGHLRREQIVPEHLGQEVGCIQNSWHEGPLQLSVLRLKTLPYLGSLEMSPLTL